MVAGTGRRSVALQRRRSLFLLSTSAIAGCGTLSFVGFSSSRTDFSSRHSIVTRLAEKAKGGDDGGFTPVVDDSQFDNPGTDAKAPAAGPTDGFTGKEAEEERIKPASDKIEKKADSFSALVKAADKFALKKERRKKKTRAISMSLEDDLMGRSIEDDLDIDLKEGLEARARAPPKLDTSLEGRIKAWAGESLQLITNPTNQQADFVFIFLSTVAILILAAIAAISMGGIKLRGQVNTEERQMQIANQPFYKRMQLMSSQRDRFLQVSDITTLSSDQGNDATNSMPLSFFPGTKSGFDKIGNGMSKEVPETVDPEQPKPPPERDPIPEERSGDIQRPRTPSVKVPYN